MAFVMLHFKSQNFAVALRCKQWRDKLAGDSPFAIIPAQMKEERHDATDLATASVGDDESDSRQIIHRAGPRSVKR